MFSYTPKFSHVVVSTFLAIATMGASVWFSGVVATAFLIGSALLFLSAASLMYGIVMTINDERWSKMESFASTYSKLDEEARAALGFKFPYLRYRMKRGQVGEYFEDTNATVEQFKLFLKTSNDKYISPRRDWYTSTQPEWAWEEIKGWLEDGGYIKVDSAAGSHSWLWQGNAYKHLMAYWLAGRNLKDMSREGEAVYAYEVEERELG
jgi:hypothetical protein